MGNFFLREKMSMELVEAFKPLVEKHYREVAHYQDIPLTVNWNQYIALENLGVFRAFTVRNTANVLVGYAWFFVKNNLHYWNSIQAVQDVLFLEESERGNGTGTKFIAWCDDQLRAEGIQAVFHHVKSKANFGPKILEPQGYELIDLIYGKRLDR